MRPLSRNLLSALIAASLLVATTADARRMGGGKSYGMSRSHSSNSYNSNRYRSNNNNTQYRQQPAQQPAQRQGMSNTGKMVAAGVAGAAVGAVAANAMADDRSNHGQMGNPSQQANDNYLANNQQPTSPTTGGFGWFWIILIAAAAFFLFRKMQAKKRLETLAGASPFASNTPDPFGTQRTLNPNDNGTRRNLLGQPVGDTPLHAPFNAGATFNSGHALPDGTEPAAFLRFARQRFNHIQAMNGASNVQEVQKYFTPDLYQAMYQDIINNDMVAEFSNLNAMVIDQGSENGQYVVSVRFTGTVSEDLNSAPEAFSEVWHFVKSMAGGEWLVAGIQQD